MNGQKHSNTHDYCSNKVSAHHAHTNKARHPFLVEQVLTTGLPGSNGTSCEVRTLPQDSHGPCGYCTAKTPSTQHLNTPTF